MVTVSLSKGKAHRGYDTTDSEHSSSSLSPLPEPEISIMTKRKKRAETRQCPVCNEHIPIRLLGVHSALESHRVETILDQVGSTDIVFNPMDDIPGPSSRARRSAVKARKSMSIFKTAGGLRDTLQHAEKTIQTIKRHRRQRLAKFREMFREEEGIGLKTLKMTWNGGEVTCPICRSTVRGDQDVVDAHIDACLANENLGLRENREPASGGRRVLQSDWDEDNSRGGYVGYVGDVRGTDFHTRNAGDEDVDDDVDVDGDGEFGEPQFTENDILPVVHPPRVVDASVEIQSQCEHKTFHDLGAEPQRLSYNGLHPHINEVGAAHMDMDLAILSAREQGDQSSLIAALETKIQQLESTIPSSPALLCRICIDPYNEPTISTGCWHTCCRECWLRCLGTTKLCPICKRITGATDLRRIFL